ncbi:hypothetical protein ERJ75_000768200 [Trypanosoma vivax]|uniref:Uncharacterized protein n=1 Tax=Trypanosoma vivax (strain Y486) TaxID=1055687 RepID=G0U3Q6_TRYVY|nr:hypothetical protein TRVL_03753 [Trypanosoma vivax]KAH8613905.1 hypothetical protein ERJ75_000768200 [Trypanosoma vivax]CCC50915.1 conserved hypothetical protein [Trypanosoma vivax Y486]
MLTVLGTWDNNIDVFMEKVGERTVEPWLLDYEERRRLNKEPRIIRQLEREDEWKDTCLEGAWACMRRFARPIDDFRVSDARFYEYLTFIGITSNLLKAKIVELFRSDMHGEIDCLHVFKALLMGLTDPNSSPGFVEHCYRSLPFATSSIEVEYEEVKRAIGKKRSTKDRKMAMELRTLQLEGVIRYYEESGMSPFTLDTFTSLFFDKDWRFWASSFIKCIFEAAAKYFSHPHGSMPVIPLRWKKLAEPLPFDRNEIYDADSILLRNLEISGKENTSGKQKGKKRRKHVSRKLS